MHSQSEWQTLFSFCAKKQSTLNRAIGDVMRVTILVLQGRDSSVGTATRYGLDGAGIGSRWGRDFPHPSRPALGPTRPPIQWVPGLSRG
jgi:hypothetical protein